MLRLTPTMLLWVGCANLFGQATLPDEVLLLSRIRRGALAALQTIPSYTCLETIERSTRRSAKQRFRKVDSIELEVAEFGDRELFAWPGQKNFDDKTGQIFGLSSNGEFAGHLKGVMAGWAGIKYGGKEECMGRLAVRYDYAVAQPFSGWGLRHADREAMTAARGSFWADPQSGTLYRLIAIAEGIPMSLGISSAEVDIRYGETTLVSQRSVASALEGTSGYFFSNNNQPLLLPQSFSVHLVLDSGEEQHNEVSLTHCREYHAVSRLLAEEAEATKTSEAPKDEVKEMELPPNLTVQVTLVSRLQSGSNRVGDRMQAKVGADVRRKGQVIVPKGADLIGRIRRLEHYYSPHEYWVGALEFTDLAFVQDGQIVHASFFGQLQGYDASAGLQRRIENEQITSDFPGVTRRVQRQTVLPGELPGVGTFVSEGNSILVKPGFRMTWLTVPLSK